MVKSVPILISSSSLLWETPVSTCRQSLLLLQMLLLHCALISAITQRRCEATLMSPFTTCTGCCFIITLSPAAQEVSWRSSLNLPQLITRDSEWPVSPEGSLVRPAAVLRSDQVLLCSTCRFCYVRTRRFHISTATRVYGQIEMLREGRKNVIFWFL